MNHSMTIGADDGEILEARCPSFGQGMHGLSVVHLDESLTALAVGRCEVEPASLARQR